MSSKSHIEAVLTKILGQPLVLCSPADSKGAELDIDFYMGASLQNSQPINGVEYIDGEID